MPGKRNTVSSRRITEFPRRRQGSFGFPRLAGLIGVIIGCFLLTVIVVQSYQYLHLREQLAQQQIRIDEYEDRNRVIGVEIERLSDLEYIESMARKHLGLVKPGETVFQLED